MALFINDEELNKFVLEQIEKKLEEQFDKGFGRTNYEALWLRKVEHLIVEKFVDKYTSDNYTDLVAKLDTDKIMKLIEAKAAIKIIATT